MAIAAQHRLTDVEADGRSKDARFARSYLIRPQLNFGVSQQQGVSLDPNTVKFFTRAWHGGDIADDRVDAIRADYQSHLAMVLPALPAQFRSFAETISIHDAQVRSIRLDRTAAVLELELRAGDRQVGYFDLTITYRGVQLDGLDSHALAEIAAGTEFEALYDEVDVAPHGGYEHRWLWWPYRDLAIRFAAFEYAVSPRPNREFDRTPTPFVEIVAPVGSYEASFVKPMSKE